MKPFGGRFGRRVLVIFAICLLAVARPGLAAAAGNSPQALVGKFHNLLLMVMRDAESLGYAGRYRKLVPGLTDNFHFPLMIQVATGSFWKKATTQQQDRLIEAFSKVSIGTYASRFSGYSGQSFVTLRQKPGPQKTILVLTKIVNPGNPDIALSYVTREIKGSWRIIDVLLDTGISELAVRRSEYRRILKNRGIDALIGVLEEKSISLRTAG